MRRIAHIISNPLVGGAETLVVSLASEQVRRGAECVILNFWCQSDVRALAAKASVPYVEVGRGRSRFISLGDLLRCRREVRRRRIDIVCAHGFRVQFLLRIFFCILRVKPLLIGVLHGVEEWRKRRHILLDRLTYQWVDGFVGVSSTVCSRWLERDRMPSSLLVCIPNGIDTRLFSRDAANWPTREELGLPRTGGIVLTVANYRAEKGHAFLLEAILRIAKECEALLFCWCGKGEDEEMLRETVRAYGLTGRIRFMGHMEDVRPLLAHAEMFVLPSREEGAPLALIEAMSMEVACIASDVGGVSEMLRDGEEGTLVQYPDADALARAIRRYHAEPDLRRRHGANARQRVLALYDIAHVAQEYDHYFDAVALRCGQLKEAL